MLSILKHAFQLLSSEHKKRVVPLILLLVVGSLLDFFSLASFIPTIIAIINPEQTSSWLNDFYDLTGLHDLNYGAIIFTGTAMLFFIFKTQLQVWITHRKATFAHEVAANLASRTLAKYMRISYSEFVKIDYSSVVNRTSNLPIIFAKNIIIPLGTILSESLVSLLLASCLLWFNYHLFVLLFVIILPPVFFYRLKRESLKKLSEQFKVNYPILIKNSLQIVEALLEIRMYRKQDFFSGKFNKPYSSLGKILSSEHTNSMIAMRTTEVIAALTVGTLILYSLITRQPSSNTMLLLSLYAGAGFRIMPSINRIFVSFLQIRTNEFTVVEIEQAMHGSPHDASLLPQRDITFENTLEFKNIFFAYPNGPLLLQNASLTILKGEKIIITGKSGGGKTSVLLLLLRFIKEQHGKIVIDGVELSPEHTLAWQKILGYVPQNPYMLDASIIENIAFGIPEDQINVEWIFELLTNLDLLSWVTQLPEGVKTMIGEKGIKISGGQRQRLAICRALYHGAEILLLDEITNQLDAHTRSEIMNIIHNGILKNKTLIMVSHHVEETNLFDATYDLREGNLVQTLKKTT